MMNCLEIQKKCEEKEEIKILSHNEQTEKIH